MQPHNHVQHSHTNKGYEQIMLTFLAA